MPQVTIYIPEELLREVRARAAQAQVSLSAYFTEMAKRTVQPVDKWPAGFIELYGSCDFSEPEDVRAEPVDY